MRKEVEKFHRKRKILKYWEELDDVALSLFNILVHVTMDILWKDLYHIIINDLYSGQLQKNLSTRASMTELQIVFSRKKKIRQLRMKIWLNKFEIDFSGCRSPTERVNPRVLPAGKTRTYLQVSAGN